MVWCGSGSEPRSRPDPPHVKIDHGVLVHTEASWDGELARVRAAILQPLPDAALRA
jgi:hypothetical protein